MRDFFFFFHVDLSKLKILHDLKRPDLMMQLVPPNLLPSVRFSFDPGNLLCSCRRATGKMCPRADPRQRCSPWHCMASPPCPAGKMLAG